MATVSLKHIQKIYPNAEASKPKKKKNKHLRAVSGYQMEIDPNTKLQNSELHKFLKACDENLA